jgi:hypothetical protein
MKISQLIQDIIIDAESRFGTSDHNNDCINVAIYHTDAGTWQVWLTRPSQTQLDRGEVVTQKVHTSKVSEDLQAFWTEKDSLLDALLDLQDFVDQATTWEEGHENRFADYDE